MFWRRKKRKEGETKKREWVTIASFSPLEGDGLADLAVAKLQSNGIPAMRFPEHNLIAHVTVTGTSPIRVIVPPDRAEEAEEILVDGYA